MQTESTNTMATDRITKQILNYTKDMQKKAKQMKFVKELKKEVEIGANGSQKYMIKQGPNKGKYLG